MCSYASLIPLWQSETTRKNPLLYEYLHHLTVIYQIIRVEKFNHTFAKLKDDVTYSCRFQKVTNPVAVQNHPYLLSGSISTQITIENTSAEYCQFVFSLANESYQELWHLGNWEKSLQADVDNVSARVNDPSRPSSQKYCWNYGELDCNVMSCPKPKDPAIITASQKLFYYKKNTAKEAKEASTSPPPPKETKPTSYTWCVPEPHENIKQVIHGHWHTYNRANPGWDEPQPSGLTASKPPLFMPSKKDDVTIQTIDTNIFTSALAQAQLDLANILCTISSNWSIVFHPGVLFSPIPVLLHSIPYPERNFHLLHIPCCPIHHPAFGWIFLHSLPGPSIACLHPIKFPSHSCHLYPSLWLLLLLQDSALPFQPTLVLTPDYLRQFLHQSSLHILSVLLSPIPSPLHL